MSEEEITKETLEITADQQILDDANQQAEEEDEELDKEEKKEEETEQ